MSKKFIETDIPNPEKPLEDTAPSSASKESVTAAKEKFKIAELSLNPHASHKYIACVECKHSCTDCWVQQKDGGVKWWCCDCLGEKFKGYFLYKSNYL
jgi:formylmethanofuran dehydrogenase subunit E